MKSAALSLIRVREQGPCAVSLFVDEANIGGASPPLTLLLRDTQTRLLAGIFLFCWCAIRRTGRSSLAWVAAW
jgi:hypothetical protein